MGTEEKVLSFHRKRSEARSAIKKTFGNPCRIDFHVINHETLINLRKIRLDLAKAMLGDIKNTAKKVKCKKEDLLLLRAELTHKIRTMEDRLSQEFHYMYDDEIDRYIIAVEHGYL